MAMPSSGPISMSQINTELGRSSTATITLDSAENGGYAIINQCSTLKPVPTNPAKLSEWYGYNHSESCSGLPSKYIDEYSYTSTSLQLGCYASCGGNLQTAGGLITINISFIRQVGVHLDAPETATLIIYQNSNLTEPLTLTTGTFFSYEITSVFIEGIGAQLFICV